MACRQRVTPSSTCTSVADSGSDAGRWAQRSRKRDEEWGRKQEAQAEKCAEWGRKAAASDTDAMHQLAFRGYHHERPVHDPARSKGARPGNPTRPRASRLDFAAGIETVEAMAFSRPATPATLAHV